MKTDRRFPGHGSMLAETMLADLYIGTYIDIVHVYSYIYIYDIYVHIDIVMSLSLSLSLYIYIYIERERDHVGRNHVGRFTRTGCMGMLVQVHGLHH